MLGCMNHGRSMTRKVKGLVALALTLVASSAFFAVGCRPTSHAVAPSELGRPSTTAAMEARLDEPGPIVVETVVGADWVVPRSGLLNLEHPTAKAAALEDGDEPIFVGFHAFRHPVHGLFLVDTGVERALRDDPEQSALGGMVRRFMNLDAMAFHTDTANWLEQQQERPAGVFLTHLHLDHVTGMRDVPAGTPVFVGPGEATSRAPFHVLTRRSIDAALAGKPLQALPFAPPAKADDFAGVLDVFGDGTVWALWVPGHTAGSVAFVLRTPTGPVLLTGDACHTAWGWEHEVEPGTFSDDQAESAVSLRRLRALVERHPSMDVRLGHQHRATATL